ncbi:MAG: M20/M25/M40 family metallo-hydrolase [Legionella sp.]|nr:MAG: M20/M25/M40 family metallo-hydrolase [Legionella sp.]
MSLKSKVLTLACFSSIAFAQSPDHLILPNCLFKQFQNKVELLAKNKEFSLVAAELNDDFLNELHAQKSTCGSFVNLDVYYQQDQPNPSKLLEQLTAKKPLKATVISQYPIKHDAQVKQLYQLIDPNKIWQTNQHLTSYENRSAKSETGVAAATWFKQEFDSLATTNKRNDVQSYLVKTGTQYAQPSVVTLIGKDKKGEAIVLGAHIDTLSGSMPGADDDASGIAVLMEIARVLLSSDIQLDRPVYLIAYAAEERGLVGSSYVVKHFVKQNIPVKAVMQLDQAGYRAKPKNQTIWLLKDYVDSGLTQFTADLLTHYVKIPVDYTECGYGCSDHVNWHDKGFKATYPSATTLDDDNPYIHTSGDSLNILNLEHMVHFTQLGIAFITELGLN